MNTFGLQQPSAEARPRGGRQWLTRRRAALASILLVGVAYATLIQSFSWNQTSHYDLIRALSHGQTTIDPYRENTGDKAFYKGHWYSARAPGLALFVLPFYDGLKAAGAEQWANESVAQRGDDEMIYLANLWAGVLPGVLLMLLVWRLADGFAPGYGAAAAVALGLGTIAFPLSTLMFSHVFTAMLGMAAFALMMRERAGPPRPWLAGLAGLAMGYAGSSEYPLLFVGLVLGVYLLSRRDSLTPRGVLARAGAYVLGGLVGLIPLALYNHYAFHSWTHLAYSSIPRQQQGFFGIGVPSLKALATLLLDSRGLFTLSPILLMGAIGTVLLYRRGRRAEALVITAVSVLYVGYNSGYYLPFGGGIMGPRFLMTMVPFLALPIGLALARYPGPTIALAGVSIAAIGMGTITHPLIGYETESIVWARYLLKGFFQPTIATAYGLGRGWAGIWPFPLAAGAALALAALATKRTRISASSLGWGVAALAGWCLFAALAPTLLGLDHQGLLDVAKAGDTHALHKHFGEYPLRALAPLAAAAGLVSLACAWLAGRSQRPSGWPPRLRARLKGRPRALHPAR